MRAIINVLKEFDDVFLEYVYIWQRASAEREKQEMEDSSIYKFEEYT